MINIYICRYINGVLSYSVLWLVFLKEFPLTIYNQFCGSECFCYCNESFLGVSFMTISNIQFSCLTFIMSWIHCEVQNNLTFQRNFKSALYWNIVNLDMYFGTEYKMSKISLMIALSIKMLGNPMQNFYAANFKGQTAS